MSVAILKRITAEAKRIRKRHPNTKWIAAVKQASKKLKGKAPKKRATKSAVKKTVRRVARKTAPRKRAATTKVRHTKSAAHYLAAARSVLIEDLGKAEARKFVATTKTAKRKIQKSINEKRAKLRKVC